MTYYEDIDKHMENNFNNYTNVKKLDRLPSKSEMKDLDRNKLYKVSFAAIAVDVVNFKSMSENTDESIFNIIMKEFTYGVVKIMKEFHVPSRVEIQGDSVYAIYRINSKDHVDSLFATTYTLNTFQKNLQKRIDKKFPNKLKKDVYGYSSIKFKFGIGASFSFDNYISIVGHGDDTDTIFMGHALNCASNLSKISSRNSIPDILIDNSMEFNLTDKKKEENKKNGGLSIVHNVSTIYKEKIYGLNLINANYNNYVLNSV
ncbi:MAG: hypothetical protein KAG14_03520 [Mycoplasmataceae bacterium]|nr:hypothetical protein [Mycoplasmataceae bacterium]